MKKVTKNIPSDNNIYPRVDLTDSNITLFEEAPVNYITINQNLTDPAQMISGDIGGDQIQWIRDNSHRVLGKKTADGVMTVCELSDTNSNNYSDGTPANLDGSEGDVFMRLPEFYYSAEETETDIWKIGFSSKNFAGSKKWDSNVLIGTYEAYYDNTKLRSISGVGSSGNISQAEFVQYSRARGTGYMIVDWTMHCIMAFLFFAYYGNTNSQRICGAGTDSYEKQTGGTNSLGMIDTEGGVISTQSIEGEGGAGETSNWDTNKNGNQGSINFWGLENWWGNKYEFIEGIEWTTEGEGIGNYTLVGNVTNLDGSTRKVTCPDPATFEMSSGCLYPTKFTIGEYLDLIPKAGLTQQEASDIGFDYISDFNYGYSDGCAVLDLASMKNEGGGSEVPNWDSCVVYRSCGSASSGGGVSYSDTVGVSSVAYPSFGSRLAFKGEVRSAASVSEFKSASAID